MEKTPLTQTPAAREKKVRDDLKAANIKWSQAKSFLPEWHAEAFKTSSGTLELKSFLAKHFGFEVDRDGHLRPRSLPHAKFKTKAGTHNHEVEGARSIATACARLVAQATQTNWDQHGNFYRDASAVRACILEQSKQTWVDFESLLACCWEMGIPVIYLPDLPSAGKKMDGMVTFVAGRPVIVLTKKGTADWALFILAHEIGHIASQHLTFDEGDAIVDETVDADQTNDVHESEANDYALRVITPNGKGVQITARVPKAPVLARQALQFGKENGIHPGHVILSVARHTKIHGKPVYSLGNAALGHLPPEVASRPVGELCREAVDRNIDLDLLRDDSIEFLEKLDVL